MMLRMSRSSSTPMSEIPAAAAVELKRDNRDTELRFRNRLTAAQ